MDVTEAEASEVVALLASISAADPAEIVGRSWTEAYAGNVTWTFRGWTIVVFNDCMSWDYLDEVIAPDGRRWDYDEMADEVRFWVPTTADGWPSLPAGDGLGVGGGT